MDFDPEIVEIYEKYNVMDTEYNPTESECKLIQSAEYAFYQGYVDGFPKNRTIRGSQLTQDQTLFQAIGGNTNTGIADWLCELTQNAFDLDATKCRLYIDISDRVIHFYHNGRGVQGPDARKGEIYGDVFALIKPGISRKTYDLYSEGRFGIGFKYWKQHFSQVTLFSEGFELSWKRNYLGPKIKRRGSDSSQVGKRSSTGFVFEDRGDGGEGGGLQPLDLEMKDLTRLRSAIRMRNRDFRLIIKIFENNEYQTFDWDHKVTNEVDFEGQRVLTCYDSDSGSENPKRTTLMEVKAGSRFLPVDLIDELMNDSIKNVEVLNERRRREELSIIDNPEKIIKQWFTEKSFVIGFFHEEGDNGNLLSMFPITDEGETKSRISFSAPFDIAESRLKLNENTKGIKEGTIMRNRILIQIFMHSFGQFLKMAQSTKILSEELISFLLRNPPGQSNNDSNLDKKIREYAEEERAFYFPFRNREKLIPSEVFNSACWPTMSGTHQIGVDAKQLDPLLIQYRQSLLQNNNKEDIIWLSNVLHPQTVVFGKDKFDCPIPVENWIIGMLSDQEGVGYSGIELEGGDTVAT